MELAKIVEKLGLEVAAGAGALAKKVESAYVSDLLSDVLANATAGTLWLTIQTHLNIVAVSTFNELAGVIITGGKRPSEDTLAEAEKEGVVILLSPASSYEVAGLLYKLGVGGPKA
jgi:hypothetical protein